MHRARAGERLEQLGGEMRARAHAIGGVVQLTRTRLEIRDQLAKGAHRQRRRHHEQTGRGPDQYDRSEIAQRLERQFPIERRIGRKPERAHRQGVAVGRGLHHLERAGVGVGAWAVQGDERLAEPLAQAFADQPRQDVVAAAHRERHDDLDGPGRIVLRRHSRGKRKS